VWAHQVPPGYYVRPSTHLEWLKTRAVPVFLHPDYQTQHPDAATWAHAQPFPKAEIEAYFGRYFTSSPGVDDRARRDAGLSQSSTSTGSISRRNTNTSNSGPTSNT
jgi:hypothetical protein